MGFKGNLNGLLTAIQYYTSITINFDIVAVDSVLWYSDKAIAKLKVQSKWHPGQVMDVVVAYNYSQPDNWYLQISTPNNVDKAKYNNTLKLLEKKKPVIRIPI